MFKALGQDYRIDRAYAICERELKLHPRRFLEMMPKEGRKEVRQQLRKLQEEGKGEYDLATIITAAHLSLLDDKVRYLVWSQIDHWRDAGKIDSSTHNHFVEVARSAGEAAKAPDSPHQGTTDAPPLGMGVAHIKIVQAALGALHLQLKSVSGGERFATDAFSLGYIFGVLDSLLQRNRLPADEVAMACLIALYGMLFNETEENAAQAARLALGLQHGKDPSFAWGTERGGNNVFGWLDGNPAAMTGWADYLQERAAVGQRTITAGAWS